MEICALEISIKEVLPAIKANCYRWSVMSLLLKMVVSGINGYWYMELLSVATTYFVCWMIIKLMAYQKKVKWKLEQKPVS